MKKILLSAFSCNPYQGSESLNGWCWSVGLVKEGFEVHTFTRGVNRSDIESHPKVDNLHVHYISLPFGLERLYSFSHPTMYLYYILWQWLAYRKGKKLQREHTFHRVHHVSWGSIQQGSFMYKLDVPFIFGPAGGGQVAPEAFKAYFGVHWVEEEKREKVSRLMVSYNPACKSMLRRAHTVLVSNRDTEKLVRSCGGTNIGFILDAALPETFFPAQYIERNPAKGELRLLWVGRFLSRKGILLVLDVMAKLKNYPGITLTIVGDGLMNEAARQKWQELGLQQSVSFVGKVPYEQVRRFYETHDTFFFTSLRDSCPAQLIEAAAFNLPVITLDLHGQGQIVTSETGIKVAMADPQTVIHDLAASIVALSNDSERYQKLSRGAYLFARDQVWSRKIDSVVEKYY